MVLVGAVAVEAVACHAASGREEVRGETQARGGGGGRGGDDGDRGERGTRRCRVVHDRFERGRRPVLPPAGNGGYDVQHYDLTMSYDPATGQLGGTAEITAKATQDLTGSTSTCAASPSVGHGRTAARPVTRRNGQELIDQPGTGARAGARPFTSWSPTPAGRPVIPIPTARSRAGCRRTTAPRRRRAAGLPRLVPGQRPPDRQGDVRAHDDRARGADRVANGEPDQPRTADGATTFRWQRGRRRWRPTSPRWRSGTSRCSAGHRPACP